MSLRSMVNSEPWDGDEDEIYTESEADGLPTELELEREREQRERDREHLLRERNHSRERPPSSHGAVLPPPPAANGHGHAGDPVSLGYVTLDDARILFDLFVNNFNTAMAVIDPVVHTHGALQSRA